MIDVFNITTNTNTQSTYTFYATGEYQPFQKPRNAKFLEIFCLGGAAGGGHCTIGAAGVTGAGGGASAGMVRMIVPAFLLPDILYIFVGKGGKGGIVSNGTGGSGSISYVSVDNGSTLTLCKSSQSSGNGGTSAGVGGTAPTIAVSPTFTGLGLFTSVAGVAGSAGGANTGTNGTSQAALGTNIVMGGAGGGGKTASVFGTGGNITSATSILTSQVNGGVTAGQNGDSGYGNLSTLCGTGGAGGAGITTGTGGTGGNGWYGCGGGGGGAGSVVAGNGGDGGDGLVIITVIS